MLPSSHRNNQFLVDCEMFQEGHEAELKNRHFPDLDVASIDFVLMIHAHIDQVRDTLGWSIRAPELHEQFDFQGVAQPR